MTDDRFHPNAMKKITAIAVLGGLLLAGCGKQSTGPTLETMLENPLFGERYSEEMVDTLTELEIDKDPLVQDKAKKTEIDAVKKQWLAVVNGNREKQHKGMGGSLVAMNEFAQGEVYLKNNMLYFGTDFETVPGPALHAYLTTAIDPRDVKFPDPTALDLGVLPLPYGAQTIPLPKHDDAMIYRTLVLWDVSLPRLYGFAQLNPT